MSNKQNKDSFFGTRTPKVPNSTKLKALLRQQYMKNNRDLRGKNGIKELSGKRGVERENSTRSKKYDQRNTQLRGKKHLFVTKGDGDLNSTILICHIIPYHIQPCSCSCSVLLRTDEKGRWNLGIGGKRNTELDMDALDTASRTFQKESYGVLPIKGVSIESLQYHTYNFYCSDNQTQYFFVPFRNFDLKKRFGQILNKEEEEEEDPTRKVNDFKWMNCEGILNLKEEEIIEGSVKKRKGKFTDTKLIQEIVKRFYFPFKMIQQKMKIIEEECLDFVKRPLACEHCLDNFLRKYFTELEKHFDAEQVIITKSFIQNIDDAIDDSLCKQTEKIIDVMNERSESVFHSQKILNHLKEIKGLCSFLDLKSQMMCSKLKEKIDDKIQTIVEEDESYFKNVEEMCDDFFAKLELNQKIQRKLKAIEKLKKRIQRKKKNIRIKEYQQESKKNEKEKENLANMKKKLLSLQNRKMKIKQFLLNQQQQQLLFPYLSKKLEEDFLHHENEKKSRSEVEKKEHQMKKEHQKEIEKLKYQLHHQYKTSTTQLIQKHQTEIQAITERMKKEFEEQKEKETLKMMSDPSFYLNKTCRFENLCFDGGKTWKSILVYKYRLCVHCGSLCCYDDIASKPCKHTKCGKCGNWFCHLCLAKPENPKTDQSKWPKECRGVYEFCKISEIQQKNINRL